jgi:hypothetical protein
MAETLVISHRGQSIRAEIVNQIGGHYDDLNDFDDCLLRDSAGRYYLRQSRYLKMPPNASDLYYEKMLELRESDPADDTELKRERLIAWRRRLTKPRTTIKRISEKSALLWCIHESACDKELKRRLREAVIAMCGNVTASSRLT